MCAFSHVVPFEKNNLSKEYEEAIEVLKKEIVELKTNINVLKEENLQLEKLKSECIYKDVIAEKDDIKTSTCQEKVDMVVFKCIMCDKDFESEISMNNHRSERHKKEIVVMVSRVSEELPNMKPTTNDSIGKKVDDVEKMLSKAYVKSPKPHNQQHSCDVCSKSFKTSTSLFEHRYLHCETCSTL